MGLLPTDVNVVGQAWLLCMRVERFYPASNIFTRMWDMSVYLDKDVEGGERIKQDYYKDRNEKQVSSHRCSGPAAESDEIKLTLITHRRSSEFSRNWLEGSGRL